ncbi:MAG: glycosyltransferase family 2 protein [Prevotella sp.]|uniref:glycosyltransferase family 2 protein n=1 Tax=Prevotella sp. TaxID=59823 RepID=UPI002A34A2BE|nr:glycosyltransferase family 2 protein [Prevotella sp.]MDD7318691.1 glycosyltransferase family 2 protein [Prevotellaceae bacterium]MDY4019352.1 glycosyltransferase family 2 protein [Prevotella sp.]
MLSIIIPVYKVEQTLERCLQSVASQGLEDCEVIMVDDGSPDGCGEICDRWAEKDSRFKVLHRSNGGLSAARNSGIERAVGDLLTFVDSDDYLAPGTLLPLLRRMQDDEAIDILEYDVVKHDGNGMERSLGIGEAVWHDAAEYWFRGRAYAHAYSWNKIYRRAVFSAVRFPVGKNFEDVHILPLLLENAKGKVVTTSHGAYHYVENPKGITHNATNEDYRSLLDAHVRFLEGHRSEMCGNDGNHFAEYYAHVLNIQITAFADYGAEVRLRGMNSYVGRWTGMGAGIGFVSWLKMMFARLFGVKSLCRLFRMLR